MKNSIGPGWLKRKWTALARALKRALLGKSSHEYTKELTGTDEYWIEVLAAQQRKHKPPPKTKAPKHGT